MITTYHVIKPDGTKTTHTVDWPGEPGLDRMKTVIEPLLDGARLEHVAVLHEGRRHDMFVDEEFVSKGLPYNAEATEIYRCNWMTQHPDVDPESLPPILGVAVLFDRLIWF